MLVSPRDSRLSLKSGSWGGSWDLPTGQVVDPWRSGAARRQGGTSVNSWVCGMMQTAEDGPVVFKDLVMPNVCRSGKVLIGDGEGKEGVMKEFG